MRQLGLTMAAARAASEQRNRQLEVLVREAEEKAEAKAAELRQLQNARQSDTPDQQRMEELHLQNNELREHTGELMARVEDMEVTHAELWSTIEALEDQSSIMRFDLETYTMFSPQK